MYPKILKEGMRFNKLTIIGLDESSKFDQNNNPIMPSKYRYQCICDCGNLTIVSKGNLISNQTKSCGCLKKINTIKANAKINPIKVDVGITKIFFFNSDKYTIIDTEDYDKVKDYCWTLARDYAVTIKRGTKERIYLHRIIMNISKNKYIDHINRNKLDNRKSNLRICTYAENNRNIEKKYKNSTSIYKGVCWQKASSKWISAITKNDKKYHLGSFTNEIEAAKAYDKKALELFGEFACTNEMLGLYKE